mgnify:FL=1
MVVVLAVNRPAWSAAALVGAVALGVVAKKSLAPALTTLTICLPVAASMLIVHAPFGTHRIAPLLTSDGLATAGTLALRFAAIMAVLVTAFAFISVPDLVKAAQVSPAGHKLSYIIGASIQLLPQGQRSVRTVRDALRLRGTKPGLVNVSIPVMTQMLTMGARRADALEAAGFDLPGRRTILRPVPDSAAQRTCRRLLPVLAIGVVLCL